LRLASHFGEVVASHFGEVEGLAASLSLDGDWCISFFAPPGQA
jgi:hypothetical protein